MRKKQLLLKSFLLCCMMLFTHLVFAQSFSSDGLLHPPAHMYLSRSETFLKASGYDTLTSQLPATRGNFQKEPYLIFEGDVGEMTVLWQMEVTEACTIEWGTDMSYSLGSESTTEYGTDHQHSYVIQSLDPFTLYYYRVIAGSDTITGTFRSAPDPNDGQLKFMAYGDTRTFPYFHNNVAEEMVDTYIADGEYQTLVLHVGDLIEDGDSESDWDDEFFATGYSEIQTLLTNVPMQACMGNHERSGALFMKYLPYPFESDRYWSFDYGPAHFTVIDQYVPYGAGSAQLAWIENDLATTDKPWKFVFFHEPGWASGGHANDGTIQDYIHPLCIEYGVHMVFAGHNHYYSRAVVDNIHHITTGGGGGPLFPPLPFWPYIVSSKMAYHFCRISIDNNALTFEGVQTNGDTFDQFSIIPALSVSPAQREVAAEGGSAYFVVSNTGDGTLHWTASVDGDDSWLSITGNTAGIENDTIFIGCTQNYCDARTGHLVITALGADNSPVTVEVNQLIAPGYPAITCPTNIIVNNDAGRCDAVVSYIDPTYTDNCPGLTLTRTGGLASGSKFPVGITINTFEVSDASGNTATCSFTVTVNDIDDPTITCPHNILVGNDAGHCYAMVTYDDPTYSDNCPGSTLTLVSGLSSGSIFPIGTTHNTFKVTDAAGNTSTCSFSVSVNDTEDPTITCPSNITVNNDADQCYAEVAYSDPAFSDNCPGSFITQTGGLPSGTNFPVGATINTFMVTDVAGHTATCSFTVMVNDTEDPTITCPDNITVSNIAGQCDVIVAFSDPTFADNCPGSTLLQTGGLTSGSSFPVGTTTNTFVVTDATGHTAACSFTVNVDDTEDVVLCDKTILTGEDTCWSALNSIIAPGANSTFIVNDGGSATLVAASFIRLMPGFIAHFGCFFHAYISNTGCPEDPGDRIALIIPQEPYFEDHLDIKLYPNPTSGNLNIEFNTSDKNSNKYVEVFDILGNELMNFMISGTNYYTIDMSKFTSGFYFLKVRIRDQIIIKKIIRR